MRIPWVRAILPEITIVAIVRNPLANVFSLLKRHIDTEGRGPEEGWWGVKPRNWRDMITSDPVEQIARQWTAVNEKLWADRESVDMVVTYEELCADPQAPAGALKSGPKP